MRAAVVVEAKAALFDVTFAGDAMAAGTAGGEIEENEPFLASMLSGLGHGNERRLDVVVGLLGNHRRMDPLVHFALVEKNAVVEGTAKQVANGGESERFAVLTPRKAHPRGFLLNSREGVLASGEKLQNPLHLGEVLRMRFDGAESRFVHVSKRCSAVKDTAPNLFANASANVDGEVADILIGHAEFDGYHEHVIRRQIRSFEGTDLLNDSALKQPDDLAAVVEIAGEAVELPRKNAVGMAAFDAAKHVVEYHPARLFGAFAFGERFDDHHSFLARDKI